MFHGLDLTPEQITIYNTCHKKAVKYFEAKYDWYKNRRPYEYSMHHKDPNLRHTDVDRYIHWYIEDLELKKNSDHVGDHSKGNQYHLGFKATDEQRQKMSSAQKGNKNASGKRSEEVKQRMSNSQKQRFANGSKAWNKGIKTGPQSEEQKKNTSEAIKRWWAQRKNNIA